MSAVGPRVVNGSGADAFVTKPFDLDEVEAIIDRLLLPDSRPDAGGNEPR